MIKPKVLVSRRWPAVVEAVLQQQYDVTLNTSDTAITPSGFRDALKEYDAILPTVTDKVGAEIFDVKTPRTKIIGNFGVGYAHIDVAAAQAAGIVVTNTPDVLSDCTADITLTLMLMAARRASEGEREIRSGSWTGWRPTHLLGTRMTGKTLGIIGFGRIGQEVAKRAHHGFGMKIIVQSRSPVKEDILLKTNAIQVDSVEELLQCSDFVSLHCPGGKENHHLIGKSQLSKMKKNAILINTARGEIVDEQALIDALNAGTLSAAGLDVFDGEPKINPRFLDCSNAVLLPHLGSATKETREAMGLRVVKNLSEFFEGKEPIDRVA
jgi:glyoxylate reductase